MNQNSVKIQKVSKVVQLIVWLVQIFLSASLTMQIVFAIISPVTINKVPYSKTPLNVLVPNIAILGIIIVILFFAGKLLKSLKFNYTPFTLENAKSLKAIAILLILAEPFYYLTLFISNQIVMNSAGSNTYISVPHIFYGGIVIALGLIVYCIALVFQHGVDLQQQSDETL